MLSVWCPEVIPVPERIHFYWIVRNQQELDWFYDLLATAVEGPAKEMFWQISHSF